MRTMMRRTVIAIYALDMKIANIDVDTTTLKRLNREKCVVLVVVEDMVRLSQG